MTGGDVTVADTPDARLRDALAKLGIEVEPSRFDVERALERAVERPRTSLLTAAWWWGGPLLLVIVGATVTLLAGAR